MVIEVLRHVDHCYTVADGTTVAAILLPYLRAGQDVVLSFHGVTDVPSSFVNGAFVSLLEDIPVEVIRSHLRIVDSTRQINDLIKSRIATESEGYRKTAYA